MSKAAQRVLAALKERNTTIVCNRDRCSFGDTHETVARRVFDELMNADALVFSHRINNLTKAYRVLTEAK